MLKRVALLCAVLFQVAAFAADWQSVSDDGGRVIEIDRASVIKAEAGKKVAWGRLRLTGAEAKRAGYSEVKALNRYDCQTLRFVTVKRVYLDRDENILREEKPTVEREIPLIPGTVDERLFREVCRTNQIAEVARIADEADRVAAAGTVDDVKPVIEKVAGRHEGPAAENPAAKPVEAAPAKPADAPAAPAPVRKKRFIQLDDLRAAAAESQRELERTGKPDDAVPGATPPEAKAPAKAPEMPSAAPPSKVAAHAAAQPAPPHAAPRISSRPIRVTHRRDVAGAPKTKRDRVGELVAMVDKSHSQPHHPVGDIHWSYDGDTGPAYWGKLKPEWAACDSGQRQSPIDIRDGIKVDLPPVKFNYHVTRFNVVDNGHTVQVNVGEGSSITVSGHEYELKQFHFHKPSEVRVNGKVHDMVVHLVHEDYQGRMAVVAVLLDQSPTGVEQPVIQTIWNNLPLEKNVEMTPDATIDLGALLPASHDYFTFMGSLTTPPCSEEVLWMVMKTPLVISADQVGIFNHLYHSNARPVQAANGRLIKESR